MFMKSAGVDLLSNACRHHGLSFQGSLLIAELQKCEDLCPGEGAGEAQGCSVHTGQCSMHQEILSDKGSVKCFRVRHNF